MNTCSISLETLLDYLEQRLAPADAQRVGQHLAGGCAHCDTRRTTFQALTEQLQESRFEAPSAGALEEATGVLRRRRPQRTLREWVARLIPLTPHSLPLVTLRDAGSVGDAVSEPVPLLFETDEHDIDLWAEPDGVESYYVIGQVRSRESGSAEVPLLVRLLSLRNPEKEQVLVPDAAGEFHISALPEGHYALIVCLATGTIQLNDIVLASRT